MHNDWHGRVTLLTVTVLAAASLAWMAAVSGAQADNDAKSSRVPYDVYVFIGDVAVWIGDEIRYTVYETSRVEARLLTPAGEIVVLLRLGEQKPGQYTLPWQGKSHEAQMAGLYGFELYFGDEYAAQFQIAVAPDYAIR